MGLVMIMELLETVNEVRVWRIERTDEGSGCEVLGPGSRALEGGDCDKSIADMVREYMKGEGVGSGQ